MGLRHRYLSALDARCVVAVPRECNTQQPAQLLRVALPRDTQHATNARAQSRPATFTPLRATGYATATQHAQQADDEAEDFAAAPSRSDFEIVAFDARVARSTWLGYPDAEGRAEVLWHRDREGDDRRLCIECLHAGPGWRCAKRDSFLLNQLQRCPNFKEKT